VRAAVLLLALGACVVPEEDDPDDDPKTYTCTAVINAGPIDYVIFGDSLTLSARGTSQILTRVLDPKKTLPVYGSWRAVDDANTATLTMTVSENRVSLITDCRLGGKTGSAGVTSTAEIDEDRITILESDRDDVEF
jgi:hypothetical protein